MNEAAAASTQGTRLARAHVPLLVGLALLLGAAGSHADAPVPSAVLSMKLVGLRSNSGQVGCMLFGSEKGFPKDPGAAAQRKWCPITNRESSCAFDPIGAGTYAVACFHDENGNGKLDTGVFGIPTEDTVTSNHAKGFMGPPSFKDAKFAFPGTATELRLKMSGS
jgi:uncharacterized protein (DUF2141 family)